MIMAKNLQDLSDLESRRKTKPEKVVDEPILLTDVPDDKFDQYIADINNQDQ